MDAHDKSALEHRGQELAAAFDDPETIARKLAEWAQANLPERVSSALWITAKGEQDKGIEIELRELTFGERFKVRLGALLGATTGGLLASTPLGGVGNVSVSVGIGAVVHYADLRRIEPVAAFTLRF